MSRLGLLRRLIAPATGGHGTGVDHCNRDGLEAAFIHLAGARFRHGELDFGQARCAALGIDRDFDQPLESRKIGIGDRVPEVEVSIGADACLCLAGAASASDGWFRYIGLK